MKEKFVNFVKQSWSFYLIASVLSGQIFFYTWVQMTFFDRQVQWIGNVFHTDGGLAGMQSELDWMKQAVIDLSTERRK